MSDTWTLASVNVNGMRSAVKKGFRDWRSRSRADVLAIQEVRMQAAQMDKEHQAPRGWKSIQADAVKKGYAGTAVWSRLPVLAASTGAGHETSTLEGRISRLDLDVATVVSAYVPSGSSRKNQAEKQARKDAYLEWFAGYAQGLLDEGRPVILTGDLNIAHTAQDIWNPTGNKKNSGFLPHERQWFSELLAQGWVDVWRAQHPEAQEYSWWSNMGQARAKDRGWRLDYVLASPDLAAKVVDARIQGRTPYLSDHCPVLVTFAR